MIEKRTRRKRIFYVPGMISLVLIPLFCLYHFYKVDAFKVYSSLEFSIPNKEDFQKYKVADLRKYQLFDFNDQKSKEEQKLNDLRFFTRDIVKRYDSVNGVKIHFGPKTSYATFISVIDILSEEKMPTWALFSDNLYAFGSAKPKPSKRGFICGTAAYSRENTIRMEEENRKEELRVFQISFIKKQWILFAGYLGLVLLNIFTLKKINKQRYS